MSLSSQTANCQKLRGKTPGPAAQKSPNKLLNVLVVLDTHKLASHEWFSPPGVGTRDLVWLPRYHLRYQFSSLPTCTPSGQGPCQGCLASPPLPLLAHIQAGQGTFRTQGGGLCSICWPWGRSLGTSQGVLTPSDPHTWPVWPGHGH